MHPLMVSFPYGPRVKQRVKTRLFFISIAVRDTRLANHRLTMRFVLLFCLDFSHSAFLHLSSAAQNFADRYEQNIFPQSPGRLREKSSLKTSGCVSRSPALPVAWLGSRRCERIVMKAPLAAIPPLLGSLTASFTGSSKGREESRSHRRSCRISHLWLCSISAPLMRRKYNQQAKRRSLEVCATFFYWF